MNEATIRAPLILPADVLLVPEAELPDDLREELRPESEDVAVTRPRGRTPSRLVDRDAAALLGQFRVPTRIVDAVIAYSRERGLDPEEMLDRSFPMFQSLLLSRMLVAADSLEAERIAPTFAAGDRLAVGTVLRCVQVLEDTELYQVQRKDGDLAALKIARRASGTANAAALAHEATVLARLDGRVNPRLLDAGTLDELPYVLMEWCPATPAGVVADELRRLAARNVRLLRLCRAIVAAYAHLHAQHVVHGDVHPRNILIGRQGAATLVDYGLARVDGYAQADRGGVPFYFEPEYARASLAQQAPPPASFAGEQYALAALLYRLITGDHYCRFPSESDALLQEILAAPALPFSARGAAPWPEVEEILRTALAKDPQERFPSIAAFTDALDRVPNPRANEAVARARSQSTRSLRGVLDDVLQRVSTDAPRFSVGPSSGPRCSINYGSAGIAYMLHRVAGARGDARLLSLADLWINKALDERHRDDAFSCPELELTPETVGYISPYHTMSGVYAVHALISHALGDVVSEDEAVDRFASSIVVPSAEIDLTVGGAGALLACATLLEIRPGDDAIRTLGETLMADIWGEDRDVRYLGIAHGWAGVIFATMRWCRATERPITAEAVLRLDELAGLGDTDGRGMRWPLRRGTPGHNPLVGGWCHGSAGYVFLWTLAYDLLGHSAHLGLAESAAWNVWETPHATANACCGLTGQAYALLNLYRHVNAREWLDRARELAVRAATATQADGLLDSLYKGQVGVALLASDMTQPDHACMPFFESEACRHSSSLHPAR